MKTRAARAREAGAKPKTADAARAVMRAGTGLVDTGAMPPNTPGQGPINAGVEVLPWGAHTRPGLLV